MAANEDLSTTLSRLLRGDTSAIQLYRANFATPQDTESLRKWVQRELDSVQSGFSSTDEVVKILAGGLQAALGQIEENYVDPGDLIDDSQTTEDKVWSSKKTSDEDALRTSWNGDWVSGTYYKYDQVEDSGWLMIANKTTEDRPAPQRQGAPFYLYDGTLISQTAAGAKQVIVGSRYTPQTSTVLVTGFRIYQELGHGYRVFTVADPDGSNIVTEIFDLTESLVDGWVDYSVSGGLVQVGDSFDLIAIVTNPAVAPASFTDDWDYQTPQNDADPGPGEIIQSRGQADVMHIHQVSDNAADWQTELGELGAGDIIDDGIMRWSIQATFYNAPGSFYTFTVTPIANSTSGTRAFTFETTVPADIEYEQDTGYWSGNPAVQGLHGVDVPYETIIPDDSQYDLDIRVQNFSVSDDWDLQSYAAVGGGSAAQILTPAERNCVRASTTGFSIGTAVTTGNGWTEVGRLNIPVGEGHRMRLRGTAKRLDGFGYFYSEAAGVAYNQAGTVAVSYSQVFEEATVNGLGIRISGDGADALVEVDGRNNEDWEWDIIGFHKQI